MASAEINKMLMRAVTDAAFRTEFLSDPAGAAKSAGASADVQKEAAQLDMRRIRVQFDHLSNLSNELLGSVVAAGHSRDWSDRANIHDNDGHIHDKAATALHGFDDLINPAAPLSPQALRDALKDPAILKEFESNPALRAALKKAVK